MKQVGFVLFKLKSKKILSLLDDHGLLVHCISGWDRTPMFISLLRLSLWADGWIHQSLTVEEMLYLTLAYDWYLFGYERFCYLIK